MPTHILNILYFQLAESIIISFNFTCYVVHMPQFLYEILFILLWKKPSAGNMWGW